MSDIKAKEREVLDIISNKFRIYFTQTKGQYDLYDAHNGRYIVEIKIRGAYYQSKSIECIKLFHLINESQKLNKSFVYIVSDIKGIYLFNITKTINEIIKKGIVCYQMPINTEFGNNRKIDKYVFNLDESLASKIISKGVLEFA